MTETTQRERDRACGKLHLHDSNFITRLINDADRLQRAEELLRASRGFVSDPNLYSVTGFTFVGTRQDCTHAIDAFLGESHD